MEKKPKKIIEGSNDKKVIRIIAFRSNIAIYAQAYDELERKTLASSSSLKIVGKLPSLAAKEVGEELAKKISKLDAKFVFDRNGYLYHGQIRSLAEGLRQGGIKI